MQIIFNRSRKTTPIRILFIYPNTFGMNMLPPAIALFNALLKQDGHKVRLFDATYYSMDYGVDSDGSKADNLNVAAYDKSEKGITMKDTSWFDDLQKEVDDFEPDLIAMSTTEDMWNLGLTLLNSIKSKIKKRNIPVIVGGVFPTFAPDLVIASDLVDMVCVGEGEEALLDLCYRIGQRLNYDNVTNLWVKTGDGRLIKNDITKPVDINRLPILDLSLFEDNRLYRPMSGEWYRMLPIETIRGCPYKCAYCNSPTQVDLYKGNNKGSFFRKKNVELIYKEIQYFIDNYNMEYAYFWADTFLAMNSREFDEFCEMYQDIKLPFWMQTRPETLSDEKIEKLADVGLHRISFGVEHGNEEFRRKYLGRSFKNKDIIEKLKIPLNHGVQFSVNNITGFPYETRELAFDTIELNRHITSDNQNLYAFVPFHGTPLRKLTEELGYVKHSDITRCLTDKPMLDQPQYTATEVAGLQRCFVLYVGMPKSRWSDIKKAEEDTPEGNIMFERLKEEYKRDYMINTSNVPDLEYGLDD
jgi:radical SAM superfamily enzyme YgiQ (UPF0313 family)